jgi:hypothetical protein
MLVISHRGCLNGANPKLENKPSCILEALNYGLDCEIDIVYDNGWYLGHDEPKYKVTFNWLVNHSFGLWLHCKSFQTLEKLVRRDGKNIWNNNLNYFWHENDRYTLTSKGYVWSLEGNTDIIKESIMVDLSGKKSCHNILGVCTDYPLNLFKKYKF